MHAHGDHSGEDLESPKDEDLEIESTRKRQSQISRIEQRSMTNHYMHIYGLLAPLFSMLRTYTHHHPQSKI